MAADRGRPRPRRSSGRSPKVPASLTCLWELLAKYQRRYASKQMLMNLVFNPGYTWLVSYILLLAEVFLNVWIIEKIKYTEIDWKSYMQEVEGALNGTLDYSLLKGDTGPLVYPAGFVYIFSGLYYLTDQGRNIRLAQYIFACFYIFTLALVFRLYTKSRKVPPYVLVLLCCCSYRIHSIYILRLFNDPIAMIFLYAALNFFCEGWWTTGSLLFSLGVSVKMNVLLFAPALLHMYFTSLGLLGTIGQLTVCAAVQVLVGAPFLLTNPEAYITGAFNMGRVFLYKWSVNWKFLPEDVFLDKHFHIGLLALHLLLLAIFAYAHWNRCLRNFRPLRKSGVAVSCQLILLPLFCSNFIGMAMSRSLHYQFYVWYYHTLPYLAWSTPLPTLYKLLMLGLIELSWNTYPATWWSSAILQAVHLILLIGIFWQRPSDDNSKRIAQKIEKNGGQQKKLS
uniref:dolichyl-P-Man:Man5GlcNAc2-PP-dolichol alpha-1,3-mannosyltransferase n=1 Tax=Hirondellea gigas TaxID=1518452 RepID=A0A2P2I132_9CRUS